MLNIYFIIIIYLIAGYLPKFMKFTQNYLISLQA